jgi:hypothetical protein
VVGLSVDILTQKREERRGVRQEYSSGLKYVHGLKSYHGSFEVRTMM